MNIDSFCVEILKNQVFSSLLNGDELQSLFQSGLIEQQPIEEVSFFNWVKLLKEVDVCWINVWQNVWTLLFHSMLVAKVFLKGEFPHGKVSYKNLLSTLVLQPVALYTYKKSEKLVFKKN